MGSSFGDDANTFKNDSAYVIDGMLSYDLGGVVPSMKGLELKSTRRTCWASSTSPARAATATCPRTAG
jgi:hypothetical protein